MKALQKKIEENIKRFDVCTLIKLLKNAGYENKDIYFQSSASLSSSAALCEGIFFSDSALKVTIILNMGLLSSNSPLPSFFRKKMDSGNINSTLFSRFLDFFDHHLIKNLLMMSMPDFEHSFFPKWRETQREYLKFLDLNSISTLEHLFKNCFPELVVRAVKFPRVFRQNCFSFTLGSTPLGIQSYLGKKIEQTVPSFKFILIGEDTHTELGVPWPLEIKKRLKNLIYVIFRRVEIHFRVTFILKNNKEVAHLSPTCRLGYCMIGENKHSLKLLIFAGYPRQLSK